MHLPCRVLRLPVFTSRLSLAQWSALCVLALLSDGCGAMRPVRGVPVQAVSDEYKAPPKACLRPIDLSLLRQVPPREHLVDTGDVLGIYIEGILASKDEVPPVQVSPCDRDIPPSVGYPIPVRDDGTITLPLADPISVRGLTFRQVEQKLRWVYTQQRPLLKTGQERILVGLQRSRSFRILVLRQEAGNSPAHQSFGTNQVSHTEKRGVGRAILLPAYRNDVLNALAETGGLPGLDAENAVYIMRGGAGSGPGCQAGLVPGCPNCRGNASTRSPGRAVVIRAQSPDENYPGSRKPSPGWDGPRLEQIPYGHTSSNRNWRYPSAGASRQPARPVSGGSSPFPNPMGPSASAGGGYSLPQSGPLDQIGMPVPDANVPMPAPESGWAGPQGPVGNNFGQQYPGINPSHRFAGPGGPPQGDATIDNGSSVRIPLRVATGEQPHFTEQDIMLWDGDVLFVDSRDNEFFYTGGLLGGGQFNIPRDYDLDVLDAIAIAEGHYGRNFINRPTKALGGVSAINQDITVGASRVVVIRRLANGSEIPIRVDLKHALANPSERLAILPGDRIVLEYTHMEAVAAFVERHLFEGFLIGAATTFLYNK